MGNGKIELLMDVDWLEIHQSIVAEGKIEDELIQPLHYLILVEKYGGFDADLKKKLPSQVTDKVAEEMAISASTLLSKRAVWNRNKLLDKARAYLKPYRDEQLALAIDYAQSAIPKLIYNLVQKGMNSENPYTIMSTIQFLNTHYINPAKSEQEKAVSHVSADDEYAAQVKLLDAGGVPKKK